MIGTRLDGFELVCKNQTNMQLVAEVVARKQIRALVSLSTVNTLVRRENESLVML